MCDNNCDITIPKGDDGDIGPQGLQGIQGEQGDPGNDGADGADGNDGTDALNYFGTSTTSINLATLVTTASLTISPVATAFQVGSRIRVVNTANPTTKYFEGIVATNNTGTGAITIVGIDNIIGASSGTTTFTAWTISLAGEKGTNTVLLVPTGAIMDYSSTTLPNSTNFGEWLFCNGQAISRTTYAALFAIIGTTFGIGDGSTTFNVPDTRKRVRVGYNSGSVSSPTNVTTGLEENYGALGNTGGEVAHDLTVTELPTHVHSLENGVDGCSSAITNTDDSPYNPLTAEGAGTGLGGDGALTVETFTIESVAELTGNTGDGSTDGLQGDAHENRQPYIVLTQIIKT